MKNSAGRRSNSASPPGNFKLTHYRPGDAVALQLDEWYF